MFTNAVRKKEGVNNLFRKVNFFQARWQSHESTANVYILAMNVSIIFANKYRKMVNFKLGSETKKVEEPWDKEKI